MDADSFFTTLPNAGNPELIDIDCIDPDTLLQEGSQLKFNQIEEFG
jgi:hypothetical protein